MRIFYRIIRSVIPLLISISVNAQIQPGSADGVDTTEYNYGTWPDSIFIFNENTQVKYVVAYSRSGGSATFEWDYYDPGSNSYLNFYNETGDSSVIDTISSPMGYRVTIDGISTRFWVLINDFNVRITSTDEEKKIRESDILCGYIDQIRAEIDSSDMHYYDPVSSDQIQYHTDYEVNLDDWYSNPNPGIAYNIFQKLNNSNLIVAIEKPYWEDTWYGLEIEDEFGLVRKDSAFHESRQPYANFVSRPIRLDEMEYYPGKSDRYYEIYDSTKYEKISAPAKFEFINRSVNADQLRWVFGDDSTSSRQNDTIIHTYDLPGFYYPRLIVSTRLPLTINACVDTFPGYDEIRDSVVVNNPEVVYGDPATLDKWPNVFTPPNGEIEYFRFTGDVSITHIDISIYNRYGKRVYEYQGNVRDWEGWNGRMKGTGKYVSTGVYYYVIKEMYELPNYDPENQGGIEPSVKPTLLRGFVHVYTSE